MRLLFLLPIADSINAFVSFFSLIFFFFFFAVHPSKKKLKQKTPFHFPKVSLACINTIILIYHLSFILSPLSSLLFSFSFLLSPFSFLLSPFLILLSRPPVCAGAASCCVCAGRRCAAPRWRRRGRTSTTKSKSKLGVITC